MAFCHHTLPTHTRHFWHIDLPPKTLNFTVFCIIYRKLLDGLTLLLVLPLQKKKLNNKSEMLPSYDKQQLTEMKIHP